MCHWESQSVEIILTQNMGWRDTKELEQKHMVEPPNIPGHTRRIGLVLTLPKFYLCQTFSLFFRKSLLGEVVAQEQVTKTKFNDESLSTVRLGQDVEMTCREIGRILFGD